MYTRKKRAISTLVIAILALSFALPLVSVSATLDTVYLSSYSGDKGDKITVTGEKGDVTSGATIEIYWDTAIGSGAHLLNSTTGKADGSFSVDFKVPEAVTGDHFVWAKDISGPDYASAKFTVVPLIKLSPESGLVGDEITVKGYGFADDDDIGVFFDSGPVYLQTENDGIATWTTTEHKTGDYSAKLEPGPTQTGPWEDQDAARVVVPVASMTLSEITSLSFWWKANGASGLPYVTIEMDSDDDGDADTWLIWNIGPAQDTTGTTVWTQWTLATAPDSWHLASLVAPYADTDTWAQMKTDYGTKEVLSCKVSIGEGSTSLVQPVYVDDIGINADSFALEAPIVETTTDDVGSFEVDFDVPIGSLYDDYFVGAADASGASDTNPFIVGASITLTPDEGPTGSVVTVEGRGWSPGNHTKFEIGIMSEEVYTFVDFVKVVDETLDEVVVGSQGTFSAEIVIPGVGSVDDYKIRAIGHTHEPADPGEEGPAYASFDVTGVSKLVVSPTYGTPGATITVTGSNFTHIAGTDVVIELHDKVETPSWVADLVIAETDEDGTFEDTFISPAVAFETYDVRAEDVYLIDADDAFKVGLIALIINPTYGEAGTMISITGIGFSPGDYNVTFGTKLYEEYGTVTTAEAISKLFWVPNFEPGTYDLTVSDTDDNELTVQFSLTESTYVIADPVMAPNGYNVSLKGYHFADFVGTVDFVIYNSTIEEDMYVRQDGNPGDPASTDDDGNFTAYWIVLDKDTLSIGDYTINVTGSKDLFVQIPFSVVAARVSVAPRKAQFDRGDMIQFDIKNDFKLGGSYIEIYDPYDTLYWSTDEFDDLWWLLVEGLYTVPYYRQTAAENPMELQSDAPMGAWLYIFYDGDDEQLMNGTFAVGPSTAAQVEEKLTEIWGSIEDLTDGIYDIDERFDDMGDDMDAKFDDMATDVQGMIDDITGDIADDLAQVAEDTEAAVSDLEGAIGDIAAAQNELSSDIDSMSQDTAAAQEAAEASQRIAQGNSTLVYAAIGASLIAALAAIVSLMQISKKIA